MSRSWQWISGIVLILVIILGARVWLIRGLYVRGDNNGGIRTSAQDMSNVVRYLRETKGWSASDVTWQSIVCEVNRCVYRVQYTYRSQAVRPETQTVVLEVASDSSETVREIYEK